MMHLLFKIPVTKNIIERGWLWRDGWYNRESDVRAFYPQAYDIRRLEDK